MVDPLGLDRWYYDPQDPRSNSNVRGQGAQPGPPVNWHKPSTLPTPTSNSTAPLLPPFPDNYFNPLKFPLVLAFAPDMFFEDSTWFGGVKEIGKLSSTGPIYVSGDGLKPVSLPFQILTPGPKGLTAATGVTSDAVGFLRGKLSAPNFRIARPGEVVKLGGGDALQHFTDARGVSGITGVSEKVLAGLKPGEQVVVNSAKFKPGVNSFLTGEGGGVGVTKLGSDALPSQLEGIGVFGAKQQYVIEFSQESMIQSGVRSRADMPSRSIWSIPGDSVIQGTITVKKVR